MRFGLHILCQWITSVPWTHSRWYLWSQPTIVWTKNRIKSIRMDKYCCRILFTCLHYLVHGSEDRSSAECPMCPCTIFGFHLWSKDFSQCTTHVNELQFTNFTLESCSFTRCYWLTAYRSTSPLQLIREILRAFPICVSSEALHAYRSHHRSVHHGPTY
jgi:hypothetical protein